MNIPEEIRTRIRDRLWALAEELGWSDLPDNERAKYYELWTRDAEIGGTLGHFMDPRKVRVYIKDSLLKPYERDRLSKTENAVLRRLDLAPAEIVESYIKPHGRLFQDGRILCWGKSRDWKLILLAAFERAFRIQDGRAYAVVLLDAGRSTAESSKTIVHEAAKRLAIERVDWIN